MSHAATRAPSAASLRTVAAPIPLAPPVTSAVCHSSLIATRSLLRGRDRVHVTPRHVG
jgi:hypothetical protein